MGVLQEFKKFALRGNVMDMAVGIIIGAAFGTVVKSLVDDIIMPPIGVVTSDRTAKTRRVEIPRLVQHPKYGKFLRRRTICWRLTCLSTRSPSSIGSACATRANRATATTACSLAPMPTNGWKTKKSMIISN